jgi:hypothetical protein
MATFSSNGATVSRAANPSERLAHVVGFILDRVDHDIGIEHVFEHYSALRC